MNIVCYINVFRCIRISKDTIITNTFPSPSRVVKNDSRKMYLKD